jgi:hypothetical protein
MSITPRTDSIVAVLNTRPEAQAIMQELQKMRFDMKKLSIAARDSHAEGHVVGCYNTSGEVRYWGDLDAFWAASGDCRLAQRSCWCPASVRSSSSALSSRGS